MASGSNITLEVAHTICIVSIETSHSTQLLIIYTMIWLVDIDPDFDLFKSLRLQWYPRRVVRELVPCNSM